MLQNKNIWITGYEFDPLTLMIKSVKISAFREDGSFIEDIYRAPQTAFKDSMYRTVSSYDEDERYVYFAVRTQDDVISTYIYAKDGSEELRKIGEYPVRQDTGLTAFHALPGGGAVISYGDGALSMFSSLGGASDTLTPGDARFTRFYSGAGVIYMYDAVSCTVYSSPNTQLRPVPVITGSFVASSESNTRFRDMHEVFVSGVGNVLGVIHTQTGSELYLGGFTFLPHIAAISSVKSAGMADWLIAIAVVSGIIISSVLLWEFFVHFMKMRMPMIIRQILLTVLVIFIAFFILSEYILIPNVTDALSEAYRDGLDAEAEVLLTSMKTGVASGAPAEAYVEFMEDFGSRFNTGMPGTVPIYAYLIAKTGDIFTLKASSDRHPGGIVLNAFLPYAEISGTLSGLGSGTQFAVIETETGRQLVLMRSSGITIDGAGTYFCVIQNLSELEGRIRSFSTLVNVFLLGAGAGLAVLLLLTIIFHVLTLGKINRILHSFTLGRYELYSDIRSGDETGEMFRHIEKLSAMLSDKDASLKSLNTSYHRFIPERFLRLLGENRIENVNKDMQTRIEGAHVVLIRFEITGGNTSDMFINANYVLEHIVPAIAQYGGTVYGFTSDGFNGVFEKNALDALKAALSARDICKRLNASLPAERGISVDLRVVLTKGDLTLGFIGDENRMEPVAISDTGLLAENLMHICFGSNVFIAATDEFFHSIKRFEVRTRRGGRTLINDKVIDFYDIYDSDPPVLSELKKSFAGKFELGVNLFEKGDYDNAGNMFIDIIKHSTGDGIARNYVYLCDYNRRNTDKQTYYTILQTESGTWKIEN